MEGFLSRRTVCFFLIGIALPIFSSSSLSAETILNEEFWAELQPFVPMGEQTVTLEKAVNLALEEARYVFGGMVYGFSFVYVPLDRARKVEEEFSLEPVFEIRRGDPNLTVHQTRRDGSRLFVRLRYELRDFQESWFGGTESNVMASSVGTGEASYYEGPEEKIKAAEEAVKNAVREYARTKIPNKPRKLSGIVVFSGAPRIQITSGRYRAVCGVKLKIDETVPYEVF